MEEKKGTWAEELPNILWAYRTTQRKSTGETPFSLTYGTKAVIPMEMGYPTLKTLSMKHEEENAEIIRSNLDMAEEMREMAAIKLQSYQQEVARQYNKTIIERIFKKGDWVLRKVTEHTKEKNVGKLGPT